MIRDTIVVFYVAPYVFKMFVCHPNAIDLVQTKKQNNIKKIKDVQLHIISSVCPKCVETRTQTHSKTAATTRKQNKHVQESIRQSIILFKIKVTSTHNVLLISL